MRYNSLDEVSDHGSGQEEDCEQLLSQDENLRQMQGTNKNEAIKRNLVLLFSGVGLLLLGIWIGTLFTNTDANALRHAQKYCTYFQLADKH